MGVLMKNGIDYTGGSVAIQDGLNSVDAGMALSAKQGNVLANDMGTFEPTSTAAYAHAVGECFMWVGQFVKVTSAIAVGDTIATGTNVATTNVATVLSELNSKISSTTVDPGEGSPLAADTVLIVWEAE